MAASSHHHYVSAGYLRFFAKAADGGKHFVQQYDKTTGRIAPRLSVRDVLTRSHHSSFMVDDVRYVDLEHEWQRIESQVLPLVRAMIDGDLEPNEEPVAVVALMGVHLARGAGTEAVYRRIVEQMLLTHPGKFAKNPRLLEHSTAEEIEEIAADALGDIDRARQARVDSMVRHCNWFIERFERYAVEAIRTARPGVVGFVTSDNPVVLSDSLRIRVGVQRIAVNDAKEVYMPLSPTLTVALSERPGPDKVASPMGVQQLNTHTRRAAVRFVVAHPDEDLRRAAL